MASVWPYLLVVCYLRGPAKQQVWHTTACSWQKLGTIPWVQACLAMEAASSHCRAPMPALLRARHRVVAADQHLGITAVELQAAYRQRYGFQPPMGAWGVGVELLLTNPWQRLAIDLPLLCFCASNRWMPCAALWLNKGIKYTNHAQDKTPRPKSTGPVDLAALCSLSLRQPDLVLSLVAAYACTRVQGPLGTHMYAYCFLPAQHAHNWCCICAVPWVVVNGDPQQHCGSCHCSVSAFQGP